MACLGILAASTCGLAAFHPAFAECALEDESEVRHFCFQLLVLTLVAVKGGRFHGGFSSGHSEGP